MGFNVVYLVHFVVDDRLLIGDDVPRSPMSRAVQRDGGRVKNRRRGRFFRPARAAASRDYRRPAHAPAASHDETSPFCETTLIPCFRGLVAVAACGETTATTPLTASIRSTRKVEPSCAYVTTGPRGRRARPRTRSPRTTASIAHRSLRARERHSRRRGARPRPTSRHHHHHHHHRRTHAANARDLGRRRAVVATPPRSAPPDDAIALRAPLRARASIEASRARSDDTAVVVAPMRAVTTSPRARFATRACTPPNPSRTGRRTRCVPTTSSSPPIAKPRRVAAAARPRCRCGRGRDASLRCRAPHGTSWR